MWTTDSTNRSRCRSAIAEVSYYPLCGGPVL